MCGIAGVLTFDGRPLPDEVRVAMTATLDRRGPDSGGVWQDDRITLMFRRLAVIDLTGGAQPMVAEEDGRTLAVLNYTGEVFNFVELRDELRCRGHRFRTGSDTEVVLRAYLEWGAACAERLVGMFAFAVWDVRTRELLLVRDRFGIYPLYYHHGPHGVIFGSEPKAVLAHPDVAGVVDLDGLREMLSFAPTPGSGVYRDVPEVRPGHIVTFSPTGRTSTCYWRLTARPHADDLPTTVATVRELLEHSVAGQLVADVPICVQLSGGLDSSAVAALAARSLRERGGGPLRTFSVDFAGHVERFRAGEMYGDPDPPYVDEMARWIGSDHTDIVVDSDDLLDPGARAAVVRALDMPAPGGEMYTSLYLLSTRIREQSTVTMTGDASDELFGGYRWFHESFYRDIDGFPWLGASHRMEMLTGLLDRGLVGELDLEGHQRERYAAALDEVPELPGESSAERRIRQITYLNLTRYLRVILDRKDRMGMASALEGRVPFLDHRLVD
jgi:asparagine synthase (glutamine-hydrolysing)